MMDSRCAARPYRHSQAVIPVGLREKNLHGGGAEAANGHGGTACASRDAHVLPCASMEVIVAGGPSSGAFRAGPSEPDSKLRREHASRAVAPALAPYYPSRDARTCRDRASKARGQPARRLSHRRQRDVHGAIGRHSAGNRSADNGEQLQRRSAAYERGVDVIFADARHVHPRQRPPGRPVWLANRVPRGDRHVHLGLDRLRAGPDPGVPGGGAHAAGRRRRDDVAGWPARDVACGVEDRSGQGDGLADDPRHDRAYRRSAGRRVYRHLPVVALDLLHQRTRLASSVSCWSRATSRRSRNQPAQHSICAGYCWPAPRWHR